MSFDIFQRSDQHGPDARPAGGAGAHARGRVSAWTIVLAALALAVAVFAALAFVWSRPSIVADAAALARVELPVTGGTSESVRAVASDGRTIPIAVRDGRLWPEVKLAPGEAVSVEVVLHRPGWIAWLAGSRTTERLVLHTPSAQLRERYVTVAAGTPLRLAFDQPVSTVAYGQPEHLLPHTYPNARSEITLGHAGEAGSIEVAAAPRRWESLPPGLLVTWFPAGAQASAVISPQSGTQISPVTPISVTFSQPVSEALGGALPRVQPAVPGHWREVDSHTIVFRPGGYGFGLDTPVALGLPHGIRIVGGQAAGSASAANWTVPPGSTLRADQILAQLGYLPLRFESASHVARTPRDQERAAVDPPAGRFVWRYPNIPSSLYGLWQPGQPAGENAMTRGALMAFENTHELELEATGEIGPQLWRALIDAEIARQKSTFGYTYVKVNEGSQSLTLWHDGSIRLTTPVNTGIASDPTELGTFPVFEHIASGTMSGTNPDGSHYEDPGIPWISYFNGGDALHGFERAQYGFPQSLGCVEMPPSTAGEVWPYTPVGTLVHVE